MAKNGSYRRAAKKSTSKMHLIYIYIYTIFIVYIYFACWGLSVRLYLINVKTAEPIGPKFGVEPLLALGR